MFSSPVLVFGASGKVGSEIVRQLVSKVVPVAAAVRNVAKSRSAVPDAVPLLQADLSDPTSVAAAVKQTSAERAFVYVVDVPDAMAAVMNALAASGMKHVVLLSSIAVETNPDLTAWTVKRHLGAENNVKAAGLTYTFIRPGPFATNAFNWKKQIAAGTVELCYPEATYAPVTISDIAAIAVAAFTSDELNNVAVGLVGPDSITQREQVNLISAAIGKPIVIKEVSEDEYRPTAPYPPPVLQTLFEFWKKTTRQPQDTARSAAVPKYAGRPATTYKEWALQNKDNFNLPQQNL